MWVDFGDLWFAVTLLVRLFDVIACELLFCCYCLVCFSVGFSLCLIFSVGIDVLVVLIVTYELWV